jgi:hypothetical protein
LEGWQIFGMLFLKHFSDVFDEKCIFLRKNTYKHLTEEELCQLVPESMIPG